MNKKTLYAITALCLTGVTFITQPARAQKLEVMHLTCENRVDPIGIDIASPRFGWQIQAPAGRQNLVQSAYEILVILNDKTYWSSGKIQSGQSIQIPYGGPALHAGTRYYWQVRIWDEKGNGSPWSPTSFFQTGFLSPGDWKAQWIEPGYQEDTSNRPAPVFRKTFAARGKIIAATLYITAHGLYEANINGGKIGDAYLTPGWTSYKHRYPYQVYDISSMIHTGDNRIAVTVGNGWYRGYIAFSGEHEYYGHDAGLLFQLDLTYADGSKQSICSDSSWKSGTGPIRYDEIYNGEKVDHSFEDPREYGVTIAAFPFDNLVAQSNEPIRAHELIPPKRIFTTPGGERVIDFGQNLVGWIDLKASGHRGDRIIVSHAEVLDKNGNFYTDNLRRANARDTFILKGDAFEECRPHFTFHGFRYIRVEGYPGELKPENFTAVVLHSDMAPTGSFSCSNPLVNQLQHNIQWGEKGNFLDVPTDCPQRDERLGWTGDAQVFSRTAMYNMGAESFFTKWLHDLAADQLSNGAVPSVIPDVLTSRGGIAGSTGWGEAATVIPWNVYLAYGDKRLLEEQYPSMRNWVEYMHSQSDNELWAKGAHYGDWLFYSPEDDRSGRSAITDKFLIAQCFYAYSTEILIKAAQALGKASEVSFYTARLQKIKEAFMHQYVTPAGLILSNTQTAYVLALQFDMLPDTLRAQAAKRLAQNIADYRYHLTTGFLGTPYICHVLTRFGYNDLAYRLLLQDTWPSWLYPVKMGATTIWERWDGIRPDSSFENASMNSFNHYAYGAIGDWMYRVIAGIDTYEDGPGYKHSRIEPHPGGGLTHAEADLQTSYGLLSSHWHIGGDTFFLEVQIPSNTKAEIFMPNPEKAAHYTLGSGVYHFSCALTHPAMGRP